MAGLITRRLLSTLAVLVFASLIAFVVLRLAPGDPAREALGPQASQGAVERLRQEHAARGEEPRFEVLKVFVGVEEGRNPSSYEQVAQSLRVGVGTAKTLIHRFRKQYTVILRQEIGRTVSDPADIEQEIHALCDALVAAEGRL